MDTFLYVDFDVKSQDVYYDIQKKIFLGVIKENRRVRLQEVQGEWEGQALLGYGSLLRRQIQSANARLGIRKKCINCVTNLTLLSLR